MIEVNSQAPDFKLNGIDSKGNEKKFSLSEILKENKDIVLYFYPKDNTPGCTQESCDFRDNVNRISSKAMILGVSPDSIKSHIKFSEKHDLNFPLLSDPEHELLEQYGAWGEKTMFGKKYMGVIRTTVLIDKTGKVRKIWNKVKVKGHVDKVIEALESLEAAV